MLPVLSGIEVCRQVRSAKDSLKTKLILFTADSDEKIHKRAVDAVIG
ncbi:MAG: DNA-binding response regulator, partial [Deltaproteobacteria bacterium]|nr:DNA-binding response regulator [Deltaproteobacteria bacterium]